MSLFGGMRVRKGEGLAMFSTRTSSLSAVACCLMLLASLAAWLSVPPDALMPVHWGPTLQPDRFASKASASGWIALLTMPALILMLPSLLARAFWTIDPRAVTAAWWGGHAVLLLIHGVICLGVLGVF